jgi:O-antigen ligase
MNFRKIFLFLLPVVFFFNQPLIIGGTFNPLLLLTIIFIGYYSWAFLKTGREKVWLRLFFIMSVLFLAYTIFSFLVLNYEISFESFKTILFLGISFVAYFVVLFLLSYEQLKKLMHIMSVSFLVVNALLMMVYIDAHLLNSRYNLVFISLFSKIKEIQSVGFNSPVDDLNNVIYRLSFNNAIESGFINAFFAMNLFILMLHRKKKSILFIVSLSLAVLAVLVSFSRSPLLVLVLFFVFRFFNLRNLKFMIPIVILSLVIIFSNADNSEAFSARYFSTENVAGGSSATERIQLVEKGLEIFQSSPFVGVGYGMFPKYYEKYTYYQNSAESAYLQVLVEGGVLGVIVVFGIFFLPVLLISNIGQLPLYKSVINFFVPVFITFLFLPFEPINPFLMILIGILIRMVIEEYKYKGLDNANIGILDSMNKR